jgi:nucleoside-diphosphate-sugar epimerase
MSTPLGDVFITGGTGYLGSRVVTFLSRNQEKLSLGKVMVLARSAESVQAAQSLGAAPIAGDLLANSEQWLDSMRQASYVIHCAQPSTDIDYAQRSEMEDVILSALDRDQLRRAVFVYGSSYFGESAVDTVMDESTPRRPMGIGPYMEPCVTRLEEKAQQGLDVVALFPGGIYGKGSWFLDSYIDSIQNDQPILIAEDPPIWPYVHVEDVARSIAHMLPLEPDVFDQLGRKFIVADDEPLPIDQFIETVGRVMKKQPQLQRLDRDQLAGILPPVAFEYLTTNMNHSNHRLLETGFRLKYPTVKSGLQEISVDRQP